MVKMLCERLLRSFISVAACEQRHTPRTAHRTTPHHTAVAVTDTDAAADTRAARRGQHSTCVRMLLPCTMSASRPAASLTTTSFRPLT
jgi:hypothetical protein